MYKRRNATLLLLAICLVTAVTSRATDSEMAFSFRVTANGLQTAWHTFGLRDGALPGLDAFDLPEPPAVPGCTLTSYLAMPEPASSLPNRWLHDYRAAGERTGERVEIWLINIETTEPVAFCQLEMVAAEPIPAGYELHLFVPDAEPVAVQVPETLDIPVSGQATLLPCELRLGGSIRVETGAWGAVKALFR